MIALGTDLAPGALPGFAEAAHNLYTLDGAAAAGEALQLFAGGRVTVAVSSLPYKSGRPVRGRVPHPSAAAPPPGP